MLAANWGHLEATLKSFSGRPLATISAVAAAVTALQGWPRLVLAFAAGSLSVLAMAPFFVWPVLFLTLPILVWLIDGAGRVRAVPAAAGTAKLSFWSRPAMRAATAGWWFGFGYLFFGLFWVGEAFLVEADKFAWLLPFAITLLPAGLALFTAAAAACARLYWPQGAARVLVLAITWAIAEWLRGHVLSGFPWNLLGYALTSSLPFMQAASVVGAYGLTPIAFAIFASPLVLLTDPGLRPSRTRIALAAAAGVLPLVVLYAYGTWRLADGPPPPVEGVRLRIVQPSIDQRDKWRAEKQGAIFKDHLDLSRQDPTGKRDDLAGITHLIWPEAAMPFLPLEHPEALSAIGDLLPAGTQLITGALRIKRTGAAERPIEGYNSLMVFDDRGALQMLYDKIHLVPFGEYLPFQSVLESIGLQQLSRWRGGFSAGPSPRPLLSIAGLPPSVALICYEAIFPGAALQRGERPGLLINVTNDGWFGNTTGPQQHFHQSRLRAVEEGLPLVRVANNGVSAVIDGNGRVVHMLALNERGVIDSDLPSALNATPYARFGDWTFVAALLVLILVTTISQGRKRADV
jgi:apolipoprotein N-acyltransferase